MMHIESVIEVYHNYIKWPDIKFMFILKIYTGNISSVNMDEQLKLTSLFLQDLMFHKENKKKFGYLVFMKEAQKIREQFMLKIDLNRL